MDYMEGLNRSISYIEDKLFDAPDYSRAAQIAGMSKSTFQRFFLAVADMTLDEYVRKRRLQYALRELTDSDRKNIDIALQCGFDSASAFSAPYAGSPDVRQAGFEKRRRFAFPRLHFQVQINRRRNDCERNCARANRRTSS